LFRREVIVTNILVAEDSLRFRRIIRRALARQDWEISAEAEDGHDAVRLATLCRPDVALVAANLPNLSSVETAKRIVALCPRTLVLTETLYGSYKLRTELQEIGIRGLVSKMQITSDLIPAIEAVLAGFTFFPELTDEDEQA
jgi:two-component system response regulator EvgA